MNRRDSKVGILVLALGLAVVGCSDDDSTPTVAPAAPSSDAPTTTSTVPSTSAPPETAPPRTTPPDTTAPTTTVTSTSSPPLVPLDELEVELVPVADGFEQPVFVTSPAGDRRLFVVDQPGRIWVIDGGEPEVFLDLRDRVVFGGEQGLLGLAFPPDHEESGLYYVDYVAAGPATRIAELTAGDVSGSERVLLEIPQPASNHNGGMVAFGPDGNLWIGMGDGGGRNDQFGQAQDPSTLLGAMLRIDPDGDPYAIPRTNPGPTTEGWASEVWGIGLRNPWRFSFDGDDLWIGDVGQNQFEEIDLVDVTAAGANFGWPLFEASACYLSGCDEGDLVFPVAEYAHDEGCSVTGGYVYRGTAVPELDGHYFFGDYCSGFVRSLAEEGGDLVEREWLPAGTVGGLTSFGVDAAGELYLTSTDGTVYRLERSPPPDDRLEP